jgi:hypothetical protein
MQEIIEYLKKIRRRYASFRSAPRDNKAVSELDTVRDWLNSMSKDGGCCHYRNPKTNPEDPPDCVVDDENGNPVGIEVTEFVCEEAVARSVKMEGGVNYREWEDLEIVRELEKILLKKDGKSYKRATYKKLILLIHTDEPLLRFDRAKKLLNGQTFDKPTQINEAYLLFSYDPSSRQSNTPKYPFIKLKFTDDQ